MEKRSANIVGLFPVRFFGGVILPSKIKVKCASCGKEIERVRLSIKNKYGDFSPKCETCKRESYKAKQSEKIKIKYRDDPVFREKVLNNSKKRYWDKRPNTTPLSSEEKQLLSELSSYPVLGPGTLGTSEPTTNWKKIVVNGQERIKGAIFLEKWHKNNKKSVKE